MNLATIAIISCLWAQAPGDDDRYEPKLRPAQKAPAAAIEDAPADDAPLDDPRAKPASHDSGRHERSNAADDDAQEAPRYRRADDSETDERMAPVDAGVKQKLRPPELLAEALETLRSGALVGTPLTLQAALARSTDRQQQFKLAQAYWRLCAAQAEYHWARNERDLLGEYTQSQTNLPGMLSARASARADVRDAQLAVTQAQQELADLLGARLDAEPPLASDRPHVGDYSTHFETIFSSRAAPPRIRLIHRTLPVRRKAIDAHAEAIVSALHALESTGDDLKQSGQGLATFLTTLEQLKHERRAFMGDVRAYNQEIAEYAFAVAPPGTNGETLVSMLIKTTRPAGAPPRNRSGSLGPTPARRDDFTTSETTDAQQQTTNYQPEMPADSADDQGVYQGLLDVESPERVQKLANLLHWDRNLPADVGEPTTLAECLRSVPSDRRLNAIAAFWQARERAAVYQALADQLEQLNALRAVAIDLRDRRGMAEAGVRLQAARRAARAALIDAQSLLLAGEFELTEAVGRRLDDAWLLPSTPPQSGRYLVSSGNRSRRASPAKRWGDMVRLHHEELEERADGVIQADVQRATLVTEARRGDSADNADEPTPLDIVLRAVARQNRETLAFLHDLTRYNMAIARFALATWPENISSDELVKTLVIARSTRRDT